MPLSPGRPPPSPVPFPRSPPPPWVPAAPSPGGCGLSPPRRRAAAEPTAPAGSRPWPGRGAGAPPPPSSSRAAGESGGGVAAATEGVDAPRGGCHGDGCPGGGVAGAPCPERARLGAPRAARRPRACSAACGRCSGPRPALLAHVPAAPSRSSMYYDEDGDLAHEFYEETIVTKNGRKRAKLKRIHKNLIPQVVCAEGRALGRQLAAPAHGRSPQTGSHSCHLAVLCRPATSLSTEEQCPLRGAVGQSRRTLWICAAGCGVPAHDILTLSTFPLVWVPAQQCHVVTELLGAAARACHVLMRACPQQ